MTNITIIAPKAQHPGNLADELGAVQAQIAQLREQEKQLKDAIIANAGEAGAVEGNFYRATASFIEAGERIDWQEAFMALVPKARQARAQNYTKGTKAFWRVAAKALPTRARAGEAA
jgi:hypothetical protein